MRGPCGAHTFYGVSREFFFFDFKDMSGKGTITISGGKNSLIQKLKKFRNIEFIIKPENMFSKVEVEEEEEEEEEEELPPRRPPRFDHDPLPDYPAYLLID